MTDKIHILQVTGIMNRGGAEVMLMDIYRNISKGIHFDFLINRRKKDVGVKGDFDDEINQLGGTIKHIDTQWELGISKYISTFKKAVLEIGKPDVVHIHLNAKCGVIALAARRCGINKIIAHSHADLKFRGSPISVLASKLELKLQKYLIARFATDYWGCSQEAINSLFYPSLQASNRVAIINNAVDVSAFQSVTSQTTSELQELLGIGKESIVLGNVGRVVRHKNVDFIIEILYKLKDKIEDIRFVFAGRSDDKQYMNEIEEKIKRYELENIVLYLDDRSDIPEIMSLFSVFIGPALKEGFGLVAAEAQASGIPCVLYTGFPESVDMGLDLVTFIDDFDITEWINRVQCSLEKKCLDGELIRRRIIEKGYDIVENTKKDREPIQQLIGYQNKIIRVHEREIRDNTLWRHLSHPGY